MVAVWFKGESIWWRICAGDGGIVEVESGKAFKVLDAEVEVGPAEEEDSGVQVGEVERSMKGSISALCVLQVDIDARVCQDGVEVAKAGWIGAGGDVMENCTTEMVAPVHFGWWTGRRWILVAVWRLGEGGAVASIGWDGAWLCGGGLVGRGALE